MGHTALRDADPTCKQHAMHLWHTSVLRVAPSAYQGNDLQTKFSMGQGPPSFFFRPIGHVITRAIRLDAAAYHNRQFPETIQLRHRAVAVIAYPQGLTALLTLLFQWGQCHCVRRFGTCGSPFHPFAPFPFVLSCSACFSSFCFQPTPAVKLSFPFSKKSETKDSAFRSKVSISEPIYQLAMDCLRAYC